MAKTRKVCDVRVYFSKNEYLEWKNVADLEWIDDDSMEFTDETGQEIIVTASSGVIEVVTKKMETVSHY